jgi:Protein of unknown function (DUF3572)
MSKQSAIHEGAEAIAIQALGFIASDPDLLPRFLSITGIEASAIRHAAREPGFLAGVLQFVPTLISFSQAANIAPGEVGKALRHLPMGDDSHQTSI